MIRRFLLVGLFVIWPFQQGQVMQLALATLFAMVYLLVQSQAQPYRNNFDNSLALGCSFSLSVLLLCCIFYKYISLTELEDMQSRMSLELRNDFDVAASLLTCIFITCTFGALAFTALLLVLQLQYDLRHRVEGFRWQLDGSIVRPPQLAQGQFHAFISVRDAVLSAHIGNH